MKNTAKKMMSLKIAIITLLIIIPIEIDATTSKFTDVSMGSWYAEPVTWAIEQGITSGTSATTFSPNETCTNAQVLTFIWRACGGPEPEGLNPFSDVKESNYYYKPALWAYERGIISGDDFQADKPCSRIMAVTYLWKEAGSPDALANINLTDVSHGDEQAVSWAVDMGITAGTSDSTFSPETICTRAQIITFLYRDFF